MHRSGSLYPPLGLAVPVLRVQVGTAAGKAGTPKDVTPGANRGRICRQQSQTGRWMSEKADMTVSMRHTEGTVPSVPTLLSQNRFLMGGLYMTWLETQRRARVRARVSHIGGLVACRRRTGTAGTTDAPPRRAGPDVRAHRQAGLRAADDRQA